MSLAPHGTVSNGTGAIKVSSSTPVFQQGDGSVKLLLNVNHAPSPNVSVPGSGKRAPAAKSQPQAQKVASSGKDPVSLKGDLRNMMHAFGDGSSPLEESVQLMELILREEMMAFLFICDTAKYWSGSRALGMRECIYTLRNDKAFLSRLFKYLISKDSQIKPSWRGRELQSLQRSSQTKSYLTEIRSVLDDLDGTGELHALLDMENLGGESWGKGVNGLNESNANLTSKLNPKYINYAKARSVSFARKLPQLQEWVCLLLSSEYKLTPSFMEVLAFLIYDLVAQIVDLSFLIKRERGGGNSFAKVFDPRGSNPDTCMSASVFLRKDEECKNISEILVLASELEAKRLKKVSTTNKDAVTVTSVHCLSPSEIREAYIRMQSSQPPSASFRSRAERIKQLNFQY